MKNIKNINIKQLTIGTVNKCNLKCPLCMRQSYMSDQDLKDSDQLNASKVISFLKVLKTENFINLEKLIVMGTLSEPLLYKDLGYLIKEIKLLFNNVLIEIHTNGSTPTSTYKQLDTILSNKDKIFIAIDGSTEEEHQRYRKGSSFKQIQSNILYIKSWNKDTRPILVSQFIKFWYNYNQENIELAKKNCKEMQFDEFLEIFSGYDMNPDFQLPYKINNWKQKLQLNKLKYNMKDLKLYPKLTQRQKDNFECLSIENKNTLIGIYINHKNIIDICDGYNEELFKNDKFDNIVTLDDCISKPYQNLIQLLDKPLFRPKRQCIECNLNNKNCKLWLSELQDISTDLKGI